MKAAITVNIARSRQFRLIDLKFGRFPWILPHQGGGRPASSSFNNAKSMISSISGGRF
jgi:hypothetical protein